MADEKKPAKKDDKPSEPSGAPTEIVILALLIGGVVLALYLFSGRHLFDDGAAPPTVGDVVEHVTEPAHLGAGDTVANRRDVVVRRDLETAQPIGTQPSGAEGVIDEGPVEAFGREWWFVNYADAPDGWVEGSQLTDRLAIARVANAPSAAVGFARPLAVYLCFAIAAALIWVWWKKREQEEIQEKKAEESRRSYFAKKGMPVPGELASAPDVAASADAEAGLPPGFPGNLPTGTLPDGWLNRGPAEPPARPAEPERWTHAKGLLASTSQSDWRAAIIEADILLEEMLRGIGYDGLSIGDMLKNVEPADMATLDKAWDAHKVRNQIAHRGSDFSITRQDAMNVMGNFEDVFREFNYI